MPRPNRWLSMSAVVAGGLLSAACKAVVISDTGTEVQLDAPTGTLVISPEVLDLGTLSLGDQANDLVTLTNEGEGDLEIFDVNLGDDNQRAHWSVDGPVSAVLSPADTINLVVVLTPQDTTDPTVTLIVVSDDPLDHQKSIEMTAVVEGQPDIRVDPETTLNMGPITVGEIETQPVVIANDGTDELSITSATFTEKSDVFSLDVDPTGSSIEPQSEAGLAMVRFVPTEPGSFMNTLLIESNDPTTPEVQVLVIGVATQ